MAFNELANMDSKTRAELQPFSAGCRTKTTILTTRSHVHHRYPHYALTKRTRAIQNAHSPRACGAGHDPESDANRLPQFEPEGVH